MNIVVTGASGNLGSLVVGHLLDAGISPGNIVATGRDESRLQPLADRGVTIRQTDFRDEGQLAAAFHGADRVLLVSTTDVEDRFGNHVRAIDTARTAGVGVLVYVSMINASTATNRLAAEHFRTEEYLLESGVPFTILRNGWYLENYTEQLGQISQSGVLVGGGGGGLISGASRSDLAAAAATVLTDDGHVGGIYELGGPAFTLAQLAGMFARELGADITYQDLPESAFSELLVGAGLPAELAAVLADADAGLSRGEFHTDSDQLDRLIGRPPIEPRTAIQHAISRNAIFSHTAIS